MWKGGGVSESSKRLFTMYADCRRMAAGSYQRIPDHHSLPVASTRDATASSVVSAATVPKRQLQNCVAASTVVSLLPLFQSDSCRTVSLHPLRCLCVLCRIVSLHPLRCLCFLCRIVSLHPLRCLCFLCRTVSLHPLRCLCFLCRTVSLHPLRCLCFLCSKVTAAELCRCTVHDCSRRVNFAATKLLPVFVATNILQVRHRALFFDIVARYCISQRICYELCSCKNELQLCYCKVDFVVARLIL